MYRHNIAFTLVEILIVVLILVILAAIVIPEFDSGAEDAKLSNLKTNLFLLRTQLELYRIQHRPTTYPSEINVQLTGRTDSDGTINAGGTCGPYLNMFPANPFVDDPVKAVKISGGGRGWDYDSATGVIAPHTAGHEGL